MTGIICAMPGIVVPATTGRTTATITVYGNTQVSTAQSKFGGASALFDGTGDYLIVTNMAKPSGDFTFECWVRIPTAGDHYIFDNDNNSQDGRMRIYNFNSASQVAFIFSGVDIRNNGSLSTNTWHHLAMTKSGTNIRAFLNGTQVGSTGTSSATLFQNQTGDFYIGCRYNASTTFPMNGYIDEYRISKVARYTANFTPSTTAFTNDSDTVFLMHANGTNASTTFTDDVGTRSQKGVSAIGNAQISTTQSKFGGASALFDGNGDYLTVIDNDFKFGTGDFTYEFWYYLPSTDVSYYSADLTDSTNQTGLSVNLLSTNVIRIRNYVSGSGTIIITSGTVIQDATWQHFALVRSSGTLTLYIDGTSAGSVSYTTDLQTNYVHLGATTLLAAYLNGNLDEIRISNNARYTANFTPSTTAFTNDSNTVLLIHADGTNASTTFTDDNA